MFVGHAALGLIAKTRRPRVAIAVLVPIAFAPDWIEVLCDLAHSPYAKMLSHSLLSVVIGSTLSALVYWVWRRGAADAAMVGLTYFSHWPADFITGTKPTWPGGPYVGLMLYDHLSYDALLECALVIAACLVYRRLLSPAARRSFLFWLLPAGLIAMQLAFAFVQDPGFLTDG